MYPFDHIDLAESHASALSSPLTLADLIEKTRPLVSKRKFIEIKSAANLVCKATRRKPETWIVRELKDLVDPMHAVHPLQEGIASNYWKTSCSKVALIMKLNGFKMLSGHCKTEMPPVWATLVARARKVNEPRLRSVLPFIRGCIGKAILPLQVAQQTYEDHCGDIDALSNRREKLRSKQSLRRNWNILVKKVDGWPQVRFEIEDKRDTYLLTEDEMPPAIVEFDAKALMPFRQSRKFGKRRLRRLSKATVDSRRYLFRRIISAAVAGAIPASRLKTMSDVCDREVLETAYNFILDRRGSEVDGTCDVSRMANLMFAVAEQWVGVTGKELEAHRDLMEDFEHIQQGMTEKNKRLLARFGSDKAIAAFLQTPARVMARYARVVELSEHDCVQMQLAAAMALLVRVLIRIENLKQIRIGTHLVENGWGRDRRVMLIFGETETKTKEYLETTIAPRAVSILDEYQARALTKLRRGVASKFLFPGYGGSHKSASCLGKQLSDFILKEAGVRVTPHQFRHLGGYFHLLRYPGDYASVQKMLGHRKLETTIKFYTGTMERRAAFAKYDDHIEARLEESEAAAIVATKVSVKAHAASA